MKAAQVDLSALKDHEVRAIEANIDPDWPVLWRDLARGYFRALLDPSDAAHDVNEKAFKAVALAAGVGRDLGGTIIYFAVGRDQRVARQTAAVLKLLRQGSAYLDVAMASGLTVSRVRQIEGEQRMRRAQELARERGDAAENVVLADRRKAATGAAPAPKATETAASTFTAFHNIFHQGT